LIRRDKKGRAFLPFLGPGFMIQSLALINTSKRQLVIMSKQRITRRQKDISRLLKEKKEAWKGKIKKAKNKGRI